MKRKSYKLFYFFGLFVLLALFTFITVSQKKPLENKVAVRLLEHLNRRIPGSEFKIDLKKNVVKPAENKCYHVTFRDFTFKTDAGWIINAVVKSLDSKITPEAAIELARIDEMTILYSPEEDHIYSQVIKGMDIDCDFLNFLKEDEVPSFGSLKVYDINASVAEAVCNWDITNAADPGKNKISKLSEFGKNKRKPFNTSMKNVKIEMVGKDKKGVKTSVFIDVEQILSTKTGIEDPSIERYVFNKGVPVPDLNKTLQKGLAVADMNVELKHIAFSKRKNGTQASHGNIGGLSSSLFIKPDDAGSFFRYGFTIDIEDLKALNSDKKEIEIFGGIKKLSTLLSMENLTPEAVLVCMNLYKKGFELRDEADNLNLQDILFLTMSLQNEIGKLKTPHIKFSIDPLKHNLGELALKAEISKNTPVSWPDAKLELNITQIDETLKKIREANLLPPPIFQILPDAVDVYMVRKENANASMLLELKEDQPGKYFLNGDPRIIQ